MVITRARSGRSVLINERLAAARRLSILLADLDGLDAAPDERLIELRSEVSSVLARIATLDEQLATVDATPIGELIEAQTQQLVTPRQRRQAARGRLQAVMLTLHGLPPSCTEAAGLLKRAVKAELRRIEQTRRQEFTRGRSP